MLRHRGTAILPLLLLLLATIVGACGEGTSTTSSASGTTTPSGQTTTTEQADTTTTAPSSTTAAVSSTTTTGAPSELTVSVYFVRDEKVGTAHRTIPYTQRVGEATVRLLIEGPNQAETAAGLSSAVPDDSELLGLTIQNGVATIDMSGSFGGGGGSLSQFLRLAQLVYTLTQFPTVQAVALEIDGEPVKVFGTEGIIISDRMTRADFEAQTPPVFVESPAVADIISSPVRIHGTANVFEAALNVEITDSSGKVVAEMPVQATSGTGTRGTFDVTLAFSGATGPGEVRAFTYSAKDGSRIHEVRIPVEIE